MKYENISQLLIIFTLPGFSFDVRVFCVDFLLKEEVVCKCHKSVDMTTNNRKKRILKSTTWRSINQLCWSFLNENLFNLLFQLWTVSYFDLM